MEQDNLFAVDDADPFVAALDRYGTWPVTVWDCDFSDPTVKQMKGLIGDKGELRTDDEGYVYFAGAKRKAGTSAMYTHTKGDRHNGVDGTFGYQKGASVFNPAVAAWIINMYAPESGLCFDPFGGGGTRAIMAAKSGLDYSGIELRLEECVAVESRCNAAGVSVDIVCGDSRDCSHMADNSADFLLTCPPYWNLEQYNGGDNDLSMCATYEEFCAGIGEVIAETKRALKPGAVAVWVVGMFRHDNQLIPMHHDIARLHTDCGFQLKEEIVLAHRNNGALQRVGNFEKGNKYLIRTHEYALVFIA